MKRFSLILVAAVFCFSFTKDTKSIKSDVKNTSYTRGERLNYRLHYGVFNAGDVNLLVSPKLYQVYGKPCYKLEASGKSVGAFAAIMKVKDIYRTYIDTTAFYPQKAFRDITEGKYKLKETTLYNQSTGTVDVKRQKKSRPIENRTYEMPPNSFDMVSVLYYVRNLDYSNMKVGDKIPVKVFFEDTHYMVDVIYKGKEKVKVRGGKYNCIKLVPNMPNNEMFDGKNSLQFWLSDDKNHVPIRCKAEMFVGAVELDLRDYSGLRYKLNQY